MQWNEWLMVSLAYAAALLLAGLGVRKLPLRKGRCGIFMAALSFFLAGEKCLASEAGAMEKDQKAAVRATTADTTAGTTAGTTAVAALPLPPEFSAPGQWAAFRSFWQKLSDIDTSAYHPEILDSGRETKAVAVENRFERATVKGVLTHEESEDLAKGFAVLFPGRQPSRGLFPSFLTAEKKDDSSRMGQLLYYTVSQRLSALAFDQSTMTRMAIPNTRLYPRSIHQRIEVRIDLLLAKQAAGDLSATEYAAIIASIENDMYLSAFIAVSSDVFPYGNLYPLPESGSEPRSVVAANGDPFDIRATFKGSPLFDNPNNWLRGWEQALDLRQKHLQEQLSSAGQANNAQKQDVTKPTTPHRRAVQHAPLDPAKALADLKESAARCRALMTELERLREPLRVLLADLERRP